MDAELLVFAAFPSIASFAVICSIFRRPRIGGVSALLVFFAAWTVGVLVQPNLAQVPVDKDSRPLAVLEDDYVSSTTCRSCHPDEYASWSDSYHRTMTQIASPEAVKGDFNDQIIEHFGLKHRFGREGDRFFCEMDIQLGSVLSERLEEQGRDSSRLRMDVTMTTGSHHMQVYWHPTGEGRMLGQVPFVYLFPEQRWVPRAAVFLQPPSDESPVDETGRWNGGCIRCHTTHGRPRIGEVLDSHVAEFGIGCESCHGPASKHVLSNRDPVTRYRKHLDDGGDDTIVNPTRLSASASSQICGQCHGVWEFTDKHRLYEWNAHGYPYRPGDEIAATRTTVQPSKPLLEGVDSLIEDDPSFLRDRFWSDGMVRVSGREYNGLIDSPCHQRGELSCLSCHTMHVPHDDPRPIVEWANDQLILGMDGNQACVQCHSEYSDVDRMMEHTHHGAESHGSNCYNCHMPHTTYGLLKAIRSHTIDSPSVEASLKTGRPNACNLCHLDQSLGWTAGHLESWYEIRSPELDEDEKTIAASLIWMLRGDAGQRALLVWAMGWEPAWEAAGNEWMVPFLTPLLDDPYDAVRLLASRTFRSLPGFDDWEYDFLASREARAEAGRRATEFWNEQQVGKGPPKFADGIRRAAAAFTRLYEARDDRDQFLSE